MLSFWLIRQWGFYSDAPKVANISAIMNGRPKVLRQRKLQPISGSLHCVHCLNSTAKSFTHTRARLSALPLLVFMRLQLARHLPFPWGLPKTELTTHLLPRSKWRETWLHFFLFLKRKPRLSQTATSSTNHMTRSHVTYCKHNANACNTIKKIITLQCDIYSFYICGNLVLDLQ